MAEPKIIVDEDRDEVTIIHPPEQEKTRRIRTYFAPRGGISWPTPTSPGYYAIFALSDEPTLTEKRSLVLLTEGEAPLRKKFFEKIALWTRRLGCRRLFANTTGDNEGWYDSFLKFVRQEKIDKIRVLDSSEFEDLERGVMIIKEWHADNALVIAKDSVLAKQLGDMTLEDLKEKPDEQFYAVMTLIRVLTSFEIYPWNRPKKRGSTDFSNWSNRDRGEESKNDYQEVYVK